MTIKSINPATEEILKEFSPLKDEQIERALEKSIKAFNDLKHLSFDQRAKRMIKAAEILESEKESFAETLTLEMGKILESAIIEIEKCAWVCRYYADNAEKILENQIIPTDAKRSYVCYDPLGPILAVMPWNFPFWQVFRFAAPALMAGNTGLLKHASNVPQSALAIEDIFKRAGFEDGAFQTLLIGSDKIESILKDDRVKAATLTGSEGAGSAVASIAGSQIKKTVLELGGSDPFIIMPSANIDAAVDAGVTGRTMNNGQSCIAAKRFIIHEDVYDEVRLKMIQKFEAFEIGDPLSDKTDIGPLATEEIRRDLDNQVQKTCDMGAIKVTGADIIEGKGYFYRPGIIENIPEGSPASDEELFGPVASLFKVSSFKEAIKLGNKTKFGLGAAIFTHDEKEIEIATKEINVGGIFINQIVASDPRLPFGGIGVSGYGRELSDLGIKEFMNVKTVSIA